MLDVIFKENNCWVNIGYLAESQGILKRFAINTIETVNPEPSLQLLVEDACMKRII